MNESASWALEALRIVTDFLSSNSITIVFLVLLIICKDSVSNFISRLSSLNYKNGETEIGVAALTLKESNDNFDLHTADEKPSQENKDKEIEVKEDNLISEMSEAFHEGRLEEAEAIFKKYAFDEKNEIKLDKNQAFYLFLKFEKGKDNSAIAKLEQLARSTKTEESKFEVLMWLSFCHRNTMQYHKETGIWRSALEETESEYFKTKAIVNLAYSLNKEGCSIEAKKLLIERLKLIEDDKQKGSIFEALSAVESSLGNRMLSIYCKDKFLEFDPNNRYELFNSAYSASDEDVEEISISNYLKLIRIDEDNSTALNNIGVRAQEAGLKIKAIELYKKSSHYNNTLAMANQGFLLLGAGFIDEAEKIAKEALAHENPHKNIHNLLAEINERKEKQDEDWEELSQKAFARQKMIREYTAQLYLGEANDLEGTWSANGVSSVTIKIDNDLLEASWLEDRGVLGTQEYKVDLVGRVSGSTFEGTYSRKIAENPQNTLLEQRRVTLERRSVTTACIGYYSEVNGEIRVLSKKLKEDFCLYLLPERG